MLRRLVLVLEVVLEELLELGQHGLEDAPAGVGIGLDDLDHALDLLLEHVADGARGSASKPITHAPMRSIRRRAGWSTVAKKSGSRDGHAQHRHLQPREPDAHRGRDAFFGQDALEQQRDDLDRRPLDRRLGDALAAGRFCSRSTSMHLGRGRARRLPRRRASMRSDDAMLRVASAAFSAADGGGRGRGMKPWTWRSIVSPKRSQHLAAGAAKGGRARVGRVSGPRPCVALRPARAARALSGTKHGSATEAGRARDAVVAAVATSAARAAAGTLSNTAAAGPPCPPGRTRQRRRRHRPRRPGCRRCPIRHRRRRCRSRRVRRSRGPSRHRRRRHGGTRSLGQRRRRGRPGRRRRRSRLRRPRGRRGQPVAPPCRPRRPRAAALPYPLPRTSDLPPDWPPYPHPCCRQSRHPCHRCRRHRHRRTRCCRSRCRSRWVKRPPPPAPMAPGSGRRNGAAPRTAPVTWPPLARHLLGLRAGR